VSRRAGPAPWLPLLLVVVLTAVLSACGQDRREIELGDAERGRELFVGYGCGACHQLGGVRQAVGHVGPRLDGLADQRIVAGSLPNTPEHVAAFIQDPQELVPGTGMPDVGVSAEDAADLAAFLLEHDG
jgi:cytochrome c